MFETVNIYTINISITKTRNVLLIIFTEDLTCLDEVKNFYFNKYRHLQKDPEKFNFIHKGKYSTNSKYFDLACEGLNYSCTFS
jgi:hypothetical protein